MNAWSGNSRQGNLNTMKNINTSASLLPLLVGVSMSALVARAEAQEPLKVATIHPQIGIGIVATTEQPANVAAYLRVSLFPPTAGTVRFLQKGIGDPFTSGEKLVEIESSNAGGTVVPILAPFDGVVANRSLDPGTFVASAAVVPGVVSILDIERIDIVTVSAGVPESAAMSLDDTTVAEVRVDALPGRILVCKPTRYAAAFQRSDRTRRVEIDVFNGTEAQFAAFSRDTAAHADLKSGKMPVLPGGLRPGESAGLLPGMFGSIKLTTTRFKGVPVVRSSAILYAGGVPYLVKVEKGLARRRPIAIDLDDGTHARVGWRTGNSVSELSVDDEIISAKQSAIEDGTPVVVAPRKP